MNVDTIVLGAGLAGLSAALDLAESGQHILVLEERGFAGGRTYSFVDEATGAVLDNGQHVYLAACTELQAWMERLGTDHMVQLQDRMRIAFRDEHGRDGALKEGFGPAPYHLGASMLALPMMSTLDTIKGTNAVMKLTAMTDAQMYTLDDISFGDWLRQAGVPEAAVKTFWNMFVIATCNADIDAVSAQLGAWVYREGMLLRRGTGSIGVLTAGLSEVLVDPAVARIRQAGGEILFHAGASKMNRSSDGKWTVQLTNEESHSADNVVVALPIRRAENLLGERLDVKALPVKPIVSLYLWLDRPIIPESVPDPYIAALGTKVQWIFDRERFCPSPHLDHGYLHCILYSGADREAAMSKDDLVAEAMDELRLLFPEAPINALRSRVIKEKSATFVPVPGQRSLRPGGELGDGLYLAGAWTAADWPSTMENALLSGRRAASAVISHAKKAIQ